MKLTREEVEAALYAADPVRWPLNASSLLFRIDSVSASCMETELCLEYG